MRDPRRSSRFAVAPSRSWRGAIMGALLASACNNTPPAQQAIEVTLAPPDPGQGFQLSIADFEVPGGTEVQDCYFVKAPDVETWIHRSVIAQNPGTHHLSVFRIGTKGALWGQPGDVVHGGQCWISSNWADWPLVANSQQSDARAPINDWTLPEGVGYKFDPGEVLMLQTHYINAAVQKTPGTGRVLINFHSVPKYSVQSELGTLFATNQNIRICPGQVNRYFDSSCRFAVQPVTVIAANTHFHSHGVYFDVSVFDPATGPAPQPFYHSTSWDEPLFMNNLNIPVAKNGGISYRCDYTLDAGACGDPTDNCCVDFGPHNQTQEHCNVFLYYYPKLESNVVCF